MNNCRPRIADCELPVGATIMRTRLVVLMAPVLVASAMLPAHAGPRNVKPGESVGTFRLNDLSGRSVDANSWAGRPSLWIFVSPQQASSEQAIIELQKVVDEMPPPGVAAVALTGDAERQFELREFAARNRLRLPIVLDAGRQVYGRIGVIVLPTTLIVDGNGKLHAALPGHDPSYAHALRAHLRFLLGKMSSDELKRELATTQPVRNIARETAERLTRSAAVMIERGLKSESVKELEQSIASDHTYIRAYLDLAVIQLGQGDVAGARSAVQEVLKQQPQDRHARLVLGMIRFQQNRLDEAKQVLEEAMLLNPDPALTNYWLGRVYEARGEADKARACYRAATERMLPAKDAELARKASPAGKP